ncbi:MAG TPA: SidA/IucD/PvdA family monooxygenase [Solirubrobacteraceae bacterium]
MIDETTKRGDYSFIGIGVGPANLSLAALADTVTGVDPLFLEQCPSFTWHPGLLFAQAELQTPFLKDLVSLVDPTSPHSFVNFLVLSGRIYRFLAKLDDTVTRKEYEQYYRWVAERLDSVVFSSSVERVTHDPDTGFCVWSNGRAYSTSSIVLATGQRPYIPPVAESLLGDSLLHAACYLMHEPVTRERRVLVVGGGQSSSEVVLHLLSEPSARPREIIWISRRPGFARVDESPFANEWFNPRYIEYFRSLGRDRKRELVENQRDAGYGVSDRLLGSIYRKLYENDFVANVPVSYRILPGHELIGIRRDGRAFRASLHSHDTCERKEIDTDIVILGTGYEAMLPACADWLSSRIEADWENSLSDDYRLAWNGPRDHRIYIQNPGFLSHGITGPHLSLGAWRSATILNSLCGYEVYATGRGDATLSLY